MSDSVWPHRWQPTRLPCPRDSPGKNTGVGCHFLLQCIKVKGEGEVAQSCLTLSDPMDCSPPGSSVHGIFQARVLEWGATAFSVQGLRYLSVCCCFSRSFSHVWLFANPWIVARQAPLSMEFPRQEYWRGLPFFSPGDLPNPQIKPMSPALAPHSSTLAWRIPWTESLVGCIPWGLEESDMTERLHFSLHALKKEMATHSSVLSWRIPGTGEPGGLPSMGSHRVGHDWSDLAAAAAPALQANS